LTVVVGETKQTAGPPGGRRGLLRILTRTPSGRIALAGAIISLAVVISVVLAPVLAPGDPNHLYGILLPPSSRHLFGTDFLGRDVFSLTLRGGEIPLLVGALSTLISGVIGVALGLIFGYRGGASEKGVTVIMDSLYAFPGLVLAMLLTAVLGASIVNTSIAVSFIFVPAFFRTIRSQVVSVKQMPYVEAAVCLGAKQRTILARYILPNVLPAIPILASFTFGFAILTESGLSFLGIGFPITTPDWGTMLEYGATYILAGKWWGVFFPGLAILIVVLGFSLLGEGLQEIYNPATN
jgi:peptide/nickel transport system permease protein